MDTSFYLWGNVTMPYVITLKVTLNYKFWANFNAVMVGLEKNKKYEH